MKKTSKSGGLIVLVRPRLITKTMRCILLLIFMTVFQVYAEDTYSQSAHLNLDLNGATIQDVLDEIENQSEFFFLFNRKLVDVDRKIDVSAQGQNVQQVLAQVFQGSDVDYVVLDRQIVLSASEYISETKSMIQGRTVSGTITGEEGEPLIGVSVRVKGTTVGSVTDMDGEFTIDVDDPNAILVFSYIGYMSQEMAVANQTMINVTLLVDIANLEEVVVIGYGTQKKVNVIGSITSVHSDELTAAPVGRVSNALAGRLPGGIFMQESGEPGNDQAIIRVRGNSTLGNNSPLVVIDGIPGRDMNSLHPDDIESISVLKDASAGIYGARAANGVILIETKRGKTEAQPTFTYNYYEGLLSPSHLPEMTDAPTYARMIREVQSYRGVDESNMRFSQEDVEKYESGAYPWTHPNTNWYEEALRKYSTTRHHGISATGGSKNISYYGSFGSQFDDGIFTNNATSYKRFNLRANVDVRINDYLSLGVDITGVQENRSYATKSSYSNFSATQRMYPTEHALFPNGLPGPDIEYGDQPMVSSSFETGFDDDKRYRSNNLLSAKLKIPGVEGLTVTSYYAYDIYFKNRRLFQKPWTLYQLDKSSYLAAGNTGVEDGSDFLLGSTKGFSEPRLTQSSDNTTSKTFNTKIDYVKTLSDDHNIEAFIAYEQNQFEGTGFEAYRRYFLTDQLPYLFAGGDEDKDNDGSVVIDARRNYFGRLSYNYQETYLFQFSFRRDGSLRFSEESGRWGNFPSVLLGWRPSQYEWWDNNLGFIDYFKLKASWGQMGNDLVDPFQYLATYGYSEGIVLGDSKSYQAGLIQSGAPNPFITWEVANVYNVGWESALFNNKLTFDADFFYERRTDILVQRNVSVPDFTGIVLPDENYGIVDNRGIEMVLGYNERIGDLGIGLNGNFAFARNKVIEADEPEKLVPWQELTGHPQGALLVYKNLGVFSDSSQLMSMPHVPGARPGDLIIEDYDEDGEITAADKQIIPLTTTPEITFGFAFNFTYKNWALNGLVQGHARAIRRIYTQSWIGTGGNYYNYDSEDRWTPENTDASKPRAFDYLEEYWRGSHVTDYTYTSVSYARLKNLQLSYTLPQSLLNKIRVKNAKVFFAGQNLLLLYSGHPIIDPENASVTRYPIMRVLSVGAQISF